MKLMGKKMYFNPLTARKEGGYPVDPNAILEARGMNGIVRLYKDRLQMEIANSLSGENIVIPFSAILKVELTDPKTHQTMIAGSSFAPFDTTEFILQYILGTPKSASIRIMKATRQQFGLMVSAIEQKTNALKAVKTKPIATNATASAYDELAKLAALRDQGVVTEEEFQEQKKKLLGIKTANQSQQRFDPQTGRRL